MGRPTPRRHAPRVDALCARATAGSRRMAVAQYANHQRAVAARPGNSGRSRGPWRRRRPDVVFAPAYSAPLTAPAPGRADHSRRVVLRAPGMVLAAARASRRRLLTGWSARRARKWCSPTRRLLAGRDRASHRPAGRRACSVIPLGMRTPASAGRGTHRRAAREPIVLYVGSVFERRRVDQLIAAFDAVADQVPGAQLEIVGENRTRRPRIDLEALRQQSRHRDRIHLRAYVDDATLAGLVRPCLGVRIPVGVRGFRIDAARSAGRWRAAGLARHGGGPRNRGRGGRALRRRPKAGHATRSPQALVTVPDRPRGSGGEILGHAPAVLAQYDWQTTAARTLAAIEGSRRWPITCRRSRSSS